MEFQHKTKSTFSQVIGIVALLFMIGISGCDGISTKGSNSGCSTGAAHLNIYDGQMARVCGCTEGAGTFNTSGALNCTVKVGTTVYFYFIGISTTHYISSTIGNTQTVSPTDSVKTAALVMNQTGTINFFDSGSGLSGTFTVTP